MVSKHFSLKNDKVFISIVTPGGTFSSDQLSEIAEFTKDNGGVIKVTEDQRIGIILDKEKAENNISKIQKMGLIPLSYKNPSVPCPKVCLGELCPLSEQNSLTDAMDTFHHLQDSLPGDFPYVSMGINGCSKSCTHSATDDIHIVAESSGYRISVGGKNTEIPVLSSYIAENVPAQTLGETVLKILKVFEENREEGERLHETVERVGTMPFQEALGTIEHEEFTEEEPLEPEIGHIEENQDEEEDIMADLGDLTESLDEEENALDADETKSEPSETNASEDKKIPSELEEDTLHEDHPIELDEPETAEASGSRLEDNNLSQGDTDVTHPPLDEEDAELLLEDEEMTDSEPLASKDEEIDIGSPAQADTADTDDLEGLELDPAEEPLVLEHDSDPMTLEDESLEDSEPLLLEDQPTEDADEGSLSLEDEALEDSSPVALAGKKNDSVPPVVHETAEPDLHKPRDNSALESSPTQEIELASPEKEFSGLDDEEGLTLDPSDADFSEQEDSHLEASTPEAHLSLEEESSLEDDTGLDEPNKVELSPSPTSAEVNTSPLEEGKDDTASATPAQNRVESEEEVDEISEATDADLARITSFLRSEADPESITSFTGSGTESGTGERRAPSQISHIAPEAKTASSSPTGTEEKPSHLEGKSYRLQDLQIRFTKTGVRFIFENGIECNVDKNSIEPDTVINLSLNSESSTLKLCSQYCEASYMGVHLKIPFHDTESLEARPEGEALREEDTSPELEAKESAVA